MQDRMDLEAEFQRLVHEMYYLIQKKQNLGSLSFDQAQQLRQMVHERLDDATTFPVFNGNESWHESEYDTDYTWDDGWSPSGPC